jgi:hypothetical protein
MISEEREVGAGLPQSLLRNDVRSRIQGCLDGELQRVLDKPPLTHITFQLRKFRQFVELSLAGLDEG